MADRQKFLAAKKRMRRILKRTIAELEQLRLDIESWNENRTDAMPFDVGRDIASIALARRLLVLVENEQPIPNDLWDRFVKQLDDNAHQ